MYSCECLTKSVTEAQVRCEECSPFWGACYPEAEDCCGPDCSPMEGHRYPDVRDSFRPDEEAL